MMDVTCGVSADVFYSKGHNIYYSKGHNHQGILGGILLESVAALIRSSGERAAGHQREKAPLWVRRNGARLLLTCPECLRGFPLDSGNEEPEMRETPCIFCDNPIQYVIDSSADTAPFARDSASVADSVVVT